MSHREAAQHTPGPWEVSGGDRRTVWSRERMVARVDAPGLPYDEEQANARLIASAPTMRATLAEASIGLGEIEAALNAAQEIAGRGDLPAMLDAIDGVREAVEALRASVEAGHA